MADYIYLLENRLSSAQQSALQAVRDLARSRGLTVFLVGGAVRDLTSGSPVRDLDVAVQGNALKFKKDLEKAGAQISGEYEPMQSLFLRFPGNVRMEMSSTVDVTFPKPGQPSVRPATIQEDLRARDFTANAMALSLNEGSYGLLMDPLNGVADIENRELRLVSNYGFIEDPARMVRAARLGARLGWQLEERTQARYEAGKAEGYISALSSYQRGYELEEIVHEEDPMRVLQRLEAEGWMTALCPAWTVARANTAELEKLREAQAQLQMQGVAADPSAVQFPLLTAKMAPKDVAALKKLFPRGGFVAEIEALEGEGRQFAAELSSKQAAAPSAAWRMIVSAPPEVVLWVAYSTRSAALQAKFRSFYTEWPQARQRIPYGLMQEMRILPELPGYDELVERLFFELMDGRLSTPEEMKAFLEPYSPPAPPPPVNLRRARAAKSARTGKGKKRETTANEPEEGVPGDLAATSADSPSVEGAAVQAAAVELEGDGSSAGKDTGATGREPSRKRPAKSAAEAAGKPAVAAKSSSGAKPSAVARGSKEASAAANGGGAGSRSGATQSSGAKAVAKGKSAPANAPREAAKTAKPSATAGKGSRPATAVGASKGKVLAAAKKLPAKAAPPAKKSGGTATAVAGGAKTAAKTAAKAQSPAKSAKKAAPASAKKSTPGSAKKASKAPSKAAKKTPAKAVPAKGRRR